VPCLRASLKPVDVIHLRERVAVDVGQQQPEQHCHWITTIFFMMP